jgi:hypothetical protein
MSIPHIPENSEMTLYDMGTSCGKGGGINFYRWAFFSALDEKTEKKLHSPFLSNKIWKKVAFPFVFIFFLTKK